MIKLNGVKINITTFPNMESLIKSDFKLRNDFNIISLKFETNEDLIYLMFIKKHIDERFPLSETKLFIPYLPYSRMDRTEGENVFTLKYVCDFINNLNFTSVVTFEAHSNVSLALLNRCQNVPYSVSLASYCVKDNDLSIVMFPDDGAQKRYSNFEEFKDKTILCGKKKRDFSTGKILNLEIEGDVPNESFDVVIIDDLCSRGGTFVYSAQKLKEAGARNIYLAITHTENTITQGELLTSDLIAKIYTTDSILDINNVKNEKLNITEVF